MRPVTSVRARGDEMEIRQFTGADEAALIRGAFPNSGADEAAPDRIAEVSSIRESARILP
jgi:hypothetical protein